MQANVYNSSKKNKSQNQKYTFNSTIGTNGFRSNRDNNAFLTSTNFSNNINNDNNVNLLLPGGNSMQRCPSSDILIKEKKMADLLTGSERAPTTYNSSMMRFSHTNMFNSIDIDKLKDEILKLKAESNQRKKEIAALRIENSRLEEDNKKNIKVVEDILHESGKSAAELINSIINKNNDIPDENNQGLGMDLSPNNFIRLREIYVINSLKKQISALKKILQTKDEEIEAYKNNTKVMKFAKLEFNYNNKLSELILLKKEYENLKFHFDENFMKLKETSEERDYCKGMMSKFKAQYEEAKNRVKVLEEEVKTLKETKKNYEEKLTYMSKCSNNNAKVLLKERENEIANLKNQMNGGSKGSNNTGDNNKRLESRIQLLTRDNKQMNEKLRQAENNLKKAKEDYETQINKLNGKISQIEKENNQNKKTNEGMKKENLEMKSKLNEIIKENADLRRITRVKTNSQITEGRDGTIIINNQESDLRSVNEINVTGGSENQLNLQVEDEYKEYSEDEKQHSEEVKQEEKIENDAHEESGYGDKYDDFDNKDEYLVENGEKIEEDPVKNEMPEEGDKYNDNQGEIEAGEEKMYYDPHAGENNNDQFKEEDLPNDEQMTKEEKEIEDFINENVKSESKLENDEADNYDKFENYENIDVGQKEEAEVEENNTIKDNENNQSEQNVKLSQIEDEFEQENESNHQFNSDAEENRQSDGGNEAEDEDEFAIHSHQGKIEESVKENSNLKANSNNVLSSISKLREEKNKGSVLFRTAPEMEPSESPRESNETEEACIIEQPPEEDVFQKIKKQETTVKEIEKEIMSAEILNSPARKMRHQSVKYMIQVNESEPQVINSSDNFYIKQEGNVIERRKKSNSIIVRDPMINIKRTPTIDRVLTEKILGNMDFDNLFDDFMNKKILK